MSLNRFVFDNDDILEKSDEETPAKASEVEPGNACQDKKNFSPLRVIKAFESDSVSPEVSPTKYSIPKSILRNRSSLLNESWHLTRERTLSKEVCFDM